MAVFPSRLSAVAAALLILAVCGPVASESPRIAKLIVFGDSFTAGIGSNLCPSPSTPRCDSLGSGGMEKVQAAGWLGRSLRERGIGRSEWYGVVVAGMRITGFACGPFSPLESAVDAYVTKDDASSRRGVVIALGANDMMSWDDDRMARRCVSNTLAHVAAKLQKADLARRVLVVIPRSSDSRGRGRYVREAVSDVASRNGYFVVDMDEAAQFCSGASLVAPDGMHPNEDGYRCVSRFIAGTPAFARFAEEL